MLRSPVIGGSAVAPQRGADEPATVDLRRRSDEGERRVKLQATLCCAVAETRSAPCNSTLFDRQVKKKKKTPKETEKQNPGIKASEPRPLSVILSAEVIRENAQNLQSSGLSQQKGGDKEVDSLLSLRLLQPAPPTS